MQQDRGDVTEPASRFWDLGEVLNPQLADCCLECLSNVGAVLGVVPSRGSMLGQNVPSS